MTSRNALWRPLVVIAALMLAALACNLQRGELEPTPATSAQVERPTVEILEPASGATLVQGELFSVTASAESPSGITQVELLVNNIPVTTQPPAENLRPEELTVVLDYTPQQSGTLTLVVRAYSGGVTGQSEPVQIQVTGPLDPGQGGAGTPLPGITPTVFNPQCRARINTPLRFRTGPGTTYDIIQTFQTGEEPPIIGYANQPDGQWWLLSSGGRTGWVSGAYTTQMGNCAGVGPAQVPPAPTQAPTATPLPTQPGATATPTPPDLRLSVLDGPRDVTLDANGTIQATYIIRVRNFGGQQAGQFNMAAAVLGQQPRDLGIVSGLGPGQEVEVPSGGVTMTYNTPGLTRLLVTVDTSNTVAESDEGNNQAYIDINVNPGVQALQALPPVEEVPTQAPPQPTATQPEVAIVPTRAPTQPPPEVLPTQADPQSLQAAPQQEAIPPVEEQPLVQEQPPVEQPPVEEQPLVEEQPPVEEPPVEEQAPADEQPVGPLLVIDAGNAPVLSELTVLTGHGGNVAGLAFSPLGGQLASGSWDGTIRLWDTATGQPLNTLSGHTDRVTGVVYSPDGSRLVSGSWDGTVRLWDVASGQQIGMFEHGAEINSVAISFDGTRIAAGGLNPEGGGLDGRIRAWDIGSSQLLGEIATYGTVSAIDFIGTDRIAAGSTGKSCSQGGDGVELYDIASGEPAVTLEGDSGWINGLAVSADGTLIAGTGQMQLCAGNGAVWVWNSSGGQPQITLDSGSGSATTAVTFGASGQIVAAGGEDGTVRVWSTGSPAPLASLSGHNAVTSVAFSPDGTLLASGGSDTTIRLWGVR